MMVLVFADSKFLGNLTPRGKPVLVTVEQIFIGLAQDEIKHIIQKFFFVEIKIRFFERFRGLAVVRRNRCNIFSLIYF